MYNTNIPLEPVGILVGNMVVSMRPIRYDRVIDARLITAHYPEVHGAPVHVGYPHLICIADLQSPDYGDSVSIYADEIPVFWPCGVTRKMCCTSEITLCHHPRSWPHVCRRFKERADFTRKFDKIFHSIILKDDDNEFMNSIICLN